METECSTTRRAEEEAQADASLRFVSRQPILDTRGAVQAYALLFRNGAESALRETAERAANSLLDHVLMEGLGRLTRGLPAFVACTGQTLTSGVVRLLPPKLTVLEIGETAQPTPELIATCHLLKAAGFRLSFGNFCWERRFLPLMRMADYVKVDCGVLRMAGIGSLEQRAGHPLTTHSTTHSTVWIAKNLASPEDYRRAREEGFSLFEGFYFCQPDVIRSRGVPVNRLSQLQVLAYLHSSIIDMHRLSEMVRQDTALTYRLLRLVNSPLYPIRREVSSVEAALMVVGEDAFRRLTTVALASELSHGNSAELLRLALTRARFCELGARWCGQDPDEQYLLGMLSLIPAMLRMEMEDVVLELPLRAPIRLALLGTEGEERCLLDWLEVYERGEWKRVRQLAAACAGVGGDSEGQRLTDLYVEAMLWAEMAMECVP